MRPDLLEGVRTLRWSGLHPSHASGITDTLIGLCQADASCRRGTTEDAAPPASTWGHSGSCLSVARD